MQTELRAVGEHRGQLRIQNSKVRFLEIRVAQAYTSLRCRLNRHKCGSGCSPLLQPLVYMQKEACWMLVHLFRRISDFPSATKAKEAYLQSLYCEYTCTSCHSAVQSQLSLFLSKYSVNNSFRKKTKYVCSRSQFLLLFIYT